MTLRPVLSQARILGDHCRWGLEVVFLSKEEQDSRIRTYFEGGCLLSLENADDLRILKSELIIEHFVKQA
jgi:hypothetical protein